MESEDTWRLIIERNETKQQLNNAEALQSQSMQRIYGQLNTQCASCYCESIRITAVIVGYSEAVYTELAQTEFITLNYPLDKVTSSNWKNHCGSTCTH